MAKNSRFWGDALRVQADMLRVNLSVAIVAMVIPGSAKNQTIEACPSSTNDSSNSTEKVKKWDEELFEIDICLFDSMELLIGILGHKVMYLEHFFMDIFFHSLLEVIRT